MKNSIKKEQSQTGLNSAERENFRTTCKKYIEITADAVSRIDNGKFVNGSLHRDPETGKIVFNVHKERIRKRDKLIRPLEHGWVKESPARYKYYQSIPKKIGAAGVVNVLERETQVAIGTIVDYELINHV